MTDPRPPRIADVHRRRVRLSTEEMVQLTPAGGEQIAALVEPAVEALNFVSWAGGHQPWFQEALRQHGALLFRGFALNTVDQFEEILQAIAGPLLRYEYASTPRTPVQGGVYTSTEYPPDQAIPLHNEMSYARRWPRLAGFFCVQPARQGGATLLGDSRRVYQRLPARIREPFERKGVQYVRNYGGGLDLGWQQVFATTDRGQVEAFCRSAGIDFEWLPADRLRTRQTCQATAIHPDTGEVVWFNQAHLFHVSSLGPELAALLRDEYAEEDLPRHAFYGDGSPLEESVLEEIRAVHTEEERSFPWQQRDFLLLDNMLIAHGRAPFEGERRVVVGLAQAADAGQQGAP